MDLRRKLAFIDLSSGKIRIKEISEDLKELYLGGRGLGSYILYNILEPHIDPLGAENVLLVSGGLLTGTLTLSAPCICVGSKSPLTGFVGSSSMGGFFRPELRFAGFDHLVVKERASNPV